MHGNVANIKGEKFGRLTVFRSLGTNQQQKMRWLCRCSCGGKTITYVSFLRRGSTQSCGCLRRERTSIAKRTHGESYRNLTPEYRAWREMLKRCYNPNAISYKNYGERGIRVCARWRRSYPNFLADMGRKPSDAHSIDRINNNKNYAPKNCQWATRSQQNKNRRRFTFAT